MNLTEHQSISQIESWSDKRLKFYLSELEKDARTLGFDLPSASEEVFGAFLRLPQERRRHINDLVEATWSANKDLPREVSSYSEISLKQEVKIMKRAIKRFGLEPLDQQIYDQFDDGDVLEIYTGEGIQIYRSWTFFKICSYSLVELLVYDWNTLYERPASIVKALFEKAPKLFEPGATTLSYNLPEYLLIERYQSRKRALKVRMKLASPLRDLATGQTTAFISTAETTICPLTENSASLNFI